MKAQKCSKENPWLLIWQQMFVLTVINMINSFCVAESNVQIRHIPSGAQEKRDTLVKQDFSLPVCSKYVHLEFPTAIMTQSLTRGFGKELFLSWQSMMGRTISSSRASRQGHINIWSQELVAERHRNCKWI